MGFLNDVRRMNVALTRAKFACYVIGSEPTLRSSTPWAALLDHAYKHKCMVHVENPKCNLLTLEPMAIPPQALANRGRQSPPAPLSVRLPSAGPGQAPGPQFVIGGGGPPQFAPNGGAQRCLRSRLPCVELLVDSKCCWWLLFHCVEQLRRQAFRLRSCHTTQWAQDGEDAAGDTMEGVGVDAEVAVVARVPGEGVAALAATRPSLVGTTLRSMRSHSGAVATSHRSRTEAAATVTLLRVAVRFLPVGTVALTAWARCRLRLTPVLVAGAFPAAASTLRGLFEATASRLAGTRRLRPWATLGCQQRPVRSGAARTARDHETLDSVLSSRGHKSSRCQCAFHRPAWMSCWSGPACWWERVLASHVLCLVELSLLFRQCQD